MQLDSSIRIHSVDVLYGEEPMAFWSNLHHHQLHAMEVPKPLEQSSSVSQGSTQKQSRIIVSQNMYLFTLISSLVFVKSSQDANG